MRVTRYLLILMGLWVFLVDDVGQALGVTSLSPYAYMIMIACAILPILYPTKGISSLAVLSTSVLLLIGLKVWNGGTIDAESLPRMAVETGAIGLTIVLANLLGTQINAIQQIFEDAGLSKLQKDVDSFETGQAGGSGLGSGCMRRYPNVMARSEVKRQVCGGMTASAPRAVCGGEMRRGPHGS